jgi:hypothetical protein
MAETIKYIGAMIASKFGGPLDTYNYTSLTNNTLASVYSNADQAGLASGTPVVKVNLNTENFDLGNNFASYKYTAPVAGYYQIIGSVYIRADTGGALTGGLCYLYKNGSAVVYGSYAGGSDIISTVSAVLLLAAGDYIELHAVGVTSSGNWKINNGAAGTFMNIYLVAKA